MSLFYQLNTWYSQPLGIEIAKSIKSKLDYILSELFGYYLLQVGIIEQQNWLENSPIINKVVITDYPEQKNSLIGENHELPFANESFDVILLPHTLEMADNPLAVLEEAYRVLAPRGTLLIIGFNPLSLWGVFRILNTRKTKAPWCGRLNYLWSIHKNIKKTGLTLTSVEEFFYKIPVESKSFVKRCDFLETLGQMVWLYPGCCYLLIAQKQVSRLQLIKPMWKLKKYIKGKQFQLPGVG